MSGFQDATLQDIRSCSSKWTRADWASSKLAGQLIKILSRNLCGHTGLSDMRLSHIMDFSSNKIGLSSQLHSSRSCYTSFVQLIKALNSLHCTPETVSFGPGSLERLMTCDSHVQVVLSMTRNILVSLFIPTQYPPCHGRWTLVVCSNSMTTHIL